jgi:tetratricopeptide (TPR) repeat protein
MLLMLPSSALALFLLAAPPGLTVDEALKLGEGWANRGDKKAVAHLQKLLQDTTLTDAQRAKAELYLGTALLQQKKPKDAAVHLQNSTKRDGSVERAWVLLGMAEDSAGDSPAALAAFKSGVAALPKSATLKHELGMAFLSAGSVDDAAKVLVEGAKLKPQDADIHTDAAYALNLAGRHKDAREHAVLAIELNAESADAHFNLGNAEAGLGNVKGAKDALSRAVQLEELHEPALLHLGMLEQGTGNDEAAAKHFIRLLQIDGENARAKAGLGVSLARLGKDDKKAKELLEQTVHADPKYLPAFVMLAELAARQGDYKEALAKMEKARALRPTDDNIKTRIAELKAEQKEAQKKKPAPKAKP